MSKRYELLTKANRGDELFAPVEDGPSIRRREAWDEAEETLLERPRARREAQAEAYAPEPEPQGETPKQDAEPRALIRTNALPPQISQPQMDAVGPPPSRDLPQAWNLSLPGRYNHPHAFRLVVARCGTQVVHLRNRVPSRTRGRTRLDDMGSSSLATRRPGAFSA